MGRMEVKIDDLSHPDVAALLAIHLGDMRDHSPEDGVHALDVDRLRQPELTFLTAWDGGSLLACGALKDLGGAQGTLGTAGEIKSMRTHPDHLRKGAARAILAHIVETARNRGYARLSLETGSGPVFDAAIGLYEAFGFERGEAFADYETNDFSRFFHLDL